MAGLTKEKRAEKARLKALEQSGDNQPPEISNIKTKPMTKATRTETGGKVTHFDKFLCAVHRKGTVDENTGLMKGITLSITATKLQRANMPVEQKIVDDLNKTNDHQNPHGNDTPMIMWYFPAGTVKEGETFKAADIKQQIEVTDEDTGETVMKKGKNIIGLKVFLNMKKTDTNEKGDNVYTDTSKGKSESAE